MSASTESSASSELSDSYYQRTGEHTYKPTVHAGGAWNVGEQHFGPLAGLIVHAVDRHLETDPGRGLALARISYDILGQIAAEECEITVRVLRPGRTIELLEVLVTLADRVVVRARAWLLSVQDTARVQDAPRERLEAPEAWDPWPMSELWNGGFVASLDVRRQARTTGRAAAWLRSRFQLVAGEESSALASFIALVDTANGIAVQQDPTEWMFPNLDLTIHLHRRPEGPWTGLDTTVSFGPEGLGLTSSVLHDSRGPVGTAEQTLTVRPLGSV